MPLFDRAFAVVDVETTGLPGLPGRDPTFDPRIIEIGLAVVTRDGSIPLTTSLLVRQPREHLLDPRAAEALQVNRISVDELLRQGIDEGLAAGAIASWLLGVRDTYGVAELRAYNAPFDFAFIERPPWKLFQRTGLDRGPCLMLETQASMGLQRRPRLYEAVDWAQRRGHDVAFAGAAHRAEADARVEAQLAIALARERVAGAVA